jgi:hypothetical protein
MAAYPTREGKPLRFVVTIKGFKASEATSIKAEIEKFCTDTYGGELSKVQRVNASLVRKLASEWS